MTTATHLPLRALALVLGTSLAFPVAAQDFGPRQELTSASSGSREAAIGDVNGDGLPDAVLATNTALELFLRKPNGGYEAKIVILAPEFGATRVHLADLDADGDLDVLYASGGSSRIRWIENLGGTTFSSFQTITGVFTSLGEIHTVDIDADGDLDVVCSSNATDGYSEFYEVFWVPNQLPSGFASRVSMGMTDEPVSMVTAQDIDSDGDLDLLAFQSFSDTLVGWRNFGSGNFGIKQLIEDFAGNATSARIADFDGDGNLDLLGSRPPSAGSGRIYLGDGTGNFGAPTTIDYDWPSPVLVEVVDIDGDGRVDLVLGTSIAGPLSWMKNLSSTGSLGFDTSREITDQVVFSSRTLAADADGNGALDIVAVNLSSDKLSWFPNDGTGTFAPEEEITQQAAFAQDALAVDFDGDGDLDVVSLSLADRKLALYESLGAGQFESQTVLASTPEEPHCLAAGDIDGDGAPDLVVGGDFGGMVVWYRNLGNGEVAPGVSIPIPAVQADDLNLADLGGDGLPDVLIASTSNNRILWVPNVPQFGLGAGQVLTNNAPEATSVAGADMDGDGDADVLFTAKASTPGVGVTWLENLGFGQIGMEVLVSELSDARSAVPVDLEGNGTVDVIACGSDTFAYTNTGNGQFAPGEQVGTVFACDMDATDMDGDGLPDVLLVRNNRLTWHQSTSPGAWTSAKVIEAGLPGPWSGRLADLDGDGDPDVLYADGSAGMVSWYENLMDPSIGVADCDPAVANSTGLPGSLTGIGSPWAPNNALTLTARDLPSDQVGLFLASPAPGFVVGAGGSQGTLCLSAPIGRFSGPDQIQSSGPDGILSLPIDLTQIPSPTGFVSVMMGEQWHFQVWYRDQNPGPTSNFTNALVIAFQ